MRQERSKVNKRRGVLICGSYGHGNAGDEAILEAIIAAFRRREPDVPITVLSRSPEETEKRHGVTAIYKFNMPAVFAAMARARLFISGGGSLIQDATSSRSLYYYLFTIMAAKILGCRVIMYGCGIGPVSRGHNRRLARMVIDSFADSITLREEDSLRELRSFGVKHPRMQVSSDPALTLERAADSEVDTAMESLGLEKDKKYICIVPRKWPGFEEKAECFALCADAIHEEMGYETLFLSIDHKNDALAAELIAKRMRSPGTIARDVFPARLTMGILSRMEGVISMRLHGLIFSAGQGVPVTGVSYDPKVNAFLRYIGQDSCIDLAELTAPRLIEETKSSLSMPQEELQRRIVRLRELESINLNEAFKLMNGEDN